jgi:hypothetical protein
MFNTWHFRCISSPRPYNLISWRPLNVNCNYNPLNNPQLFHRPVQPFRRLPRLHRILNLTPQHLSLPLLRILLRTASPLTLGLLARLSLLI